MRTYRADIDGLRAIAVLSVVIYHCGFQLSEGRFLLPGGYLGVDVFFVISGYLIGSHILEDAKAGTFSLVRFYEKRARRILPALFTVVAASLVVGWLVLLPNAMVELADSAVATLTFWSNYFFWQKGGYAATANELRPLLHTWSLSIEEQFYLFAPLLALPVWLRLPKARLLLLGVALLVSLLLAEYATRRSPDASFYLLPTRAWELAVGVLLAEFEMRLGRRGAAKVAAFAAPVAMVTLLLCVATFSASNIHPGLVTVIPVGASAAVIWWGGGRDVATRLLSRPSAVAIGLASYSIYLWHQPVLAFARLASPSSLEAAALGGLALLSVGLGFASWRLVERPFRHPGLVPKGRLWSSVLLGLLVLLGGSTIVSYGGGYPDRFAPILVAAQPAQEWWKLEQDGAACHSKRLDHCSFVLDGPSGDRWILVGDSHGGALAPALIDQLRPIAGRLDLLTWGGCPVIFDVDHERQSDKELACKERNDFVRQFLISQAPSTVVYAARMPLWLSGQRFDNGEGGVEPGDVADLMATNGATLQEAITRTIDEIGAMGHLVVLIYPVPEVGWDLPQHMRNLMPNTSPAGLTEWLSKHPVSTSLARYLERSRDTFVAYDNAQRFEVVRVYPHEVFCSEQTGRCATHDLEAFFYSDDDHLSYAGASMLGSAIISATR